MPASRIFLAVPPVESSSTPKSASSLANPSIPALSVRLINARVIVFMVNSYFDMSSKVIFSLFRALFTFILADEFLDFPPVPLARLFVRQGLAGCQQGAHSGRLLT